ncbi:cytochrome C oxidase assembly protein [Actinokineospora bangkokensis]|uniref:Cytochrome C oxidase assembly protein n=2 Tax=Actinokineospora bangkokensis TaxID=1193682 RepID=A0A1Q9LPE6_9PSEU|nr:cytochrome C oxidase assembly protein [Actinokineospora bangkokensis]
MHHHGADAGAALPALVLALAAATYLSLVRRSRARNPARGWSPWRTASFGAGLVLLAVAFLPPVATWARADFRGHMVQHLIVGMYAPVALVLGAPATLLLRALPVHQGRRLSALLHSRPLRALAHPLTALLLSTVSLVPLYFTPLFTVLTAHPAGHWLLHAHFLVAGTLFAHVIAGPDPHPGRPGTRTRLVYLGCAIAVHAVVSQLLYGGFWTRVDAPADQVRGAAEVMYYGGDLAELLLAVALLTTARTRARRSAAAASA